MTEASIDALPWHTKIWDRLARGRERLPHALLMTGTAGQGKHQFARRLAAGLLCPQPVGELQPCGQCRDCHLVTQGSHPELRFLAPEEEGKAIKVDQLRGLLEGTVLGAGSAGWRVFIVDPADAMTPSAANALLKTLEEPVPGALFLLVTAQPWRLPITIRSRCQSLHFPTPERAVAEAWLGQQLPGQDAALLLSLAGGGPLQALALVDDELIQARAGFVQTVSGLLAGQADPIQVAAAWHAQGAERILSWLAGWLLDLARHGVVTEPPVLQHVDQSALLQRQSKDIDLETCLKLLGAVLERQRGLRGNLNPQLVLEEIAMRIAAVTGRA